MKYKKKKFNKFSVALGLLDYINPILYSVTIITVIKKFYPIMESPYNIILLIGAIISIFFGLAIPTFKVLVGLKILKFSSPVSLVFSVNSGILLSGVILINYVMNFNIIILSIILACIVGLLIFYFIIKNSNTIAVLVGALGYILIYISLILLSIEYCLIVPIIMYAFAIVLFLMLCLIGIKSDLKNPRVHWIIESSNIICQLLVATATMILLA